MTEGAVLPSDAAETEGPVVLVAIGPGATALALPLPLLGPIPVGPTLLLALVIADPVPTSLVP